MGDAESRSKDLLGRVYEYFLGRFASAEGKGGGEFYTARCVVKLLVEMIEPFKGRVYDPCCGSGGMFVQSERFVEEHGGGKGDIAIYGQESNPTTWRLAKMNLAIRGLEGDLGPHNADTFHDDLHKDLKADFILANPPFNVSDWGGDRLRDDVRWKYGAPPAGNANFAWVQHMVHHLAPQGVAGFVLANGSMSSQQSGEGEIRKQLVEADLVDCMIALPGQLFYTTQIPVCLWFLARDKSDGPGSGGRCRDRRGETLFIDARQMGALVDRTHKELSDEDIARIAGTYHAWRGEPGTSGYADVPGFCKSAADRADRRARLRAHPRPLRRRRRRRRRRRALRREDEAPDGGAGGAVRRVGEAGGRDQGELWGRWGMTTSTRSLRTPANADAFPPAWRGLGSITSATPLSIARARHSPSPKPARSRRSQDIRTGVFRVRVCRPRVRGYLPGTRIARAEPSHGDLLYSRERHLLRNRRRGSQ